MEVTKPEVHLVQEKKVSVDIANDREVKWMEPAIPTSREVIDLTGDEPMVITQFLCTKCGKEVQETDRACRFCGEYRPKAGETFDISKVNFSLPNMLAARYRPSKRAENKHEMPFPCMIGEDVTQSQEANEWILNHLPLKEEEKEKMIAEFYDERNKQIKREKIEQRSKIRREERDTQLHESLQRRSHAKRTRRLEGELNGLKFLLSRKGVKDITS